MSASTDTEASTDPNTVTVYIDGFTPSVSETFASNNIGRHIAELHANMLGKSRAQVALRKGLEALARSLLVTYKDNERGRGDSNVRVVGISIKAVEYTFIFGVTSKDTSDG